MTKLAVEVLDASDLKPLDGAVYVEVEFDRQLHRTHSLLHDPTPQWNDKLLFDVRDLRDLHKKTVDVSVYSDPRGGASRKHLLGRVRISGISVPSSESDAHPQRYPLETRGILSRVRGDISLRLYLLAADDGLSSGFVPPPVDVFGAGATVRESSWDVESPLRERDVNAGNLGGVREEPVRVDEGGKKRDKDKEVRTFHSIGTEAAAAPLRMPAPAPTLFSSLPEVNLMKETAPAVKARADFARAGPAAAMQLRVPTQNPEFSLVETRPPIAAHLRYRDGDKTRSTYDLVEQMHYLYVRIVKGRNLPDMDVTGSLDPYVEIKVGNYKGITKHLEKNQNPVWNQIFAFPRERLQSNFIELIVKDKDFGKDDFVGRVVFDITEVPTRVPPDSPLAPLWHRLEGKRGEKLPQAEIMVVVWIGTQADESFPEAWHADAHSISHTNLHNTRSKVYFSPKLHYLRVQVVEAQDLVPSDRGRMPDTYVKVQVGNQMRVTRPAKTINPVWNDELMFVVPEPFEDFVIVSVDDRVGPGKDEPLGRLIIPVRGIPLRAETSKLPDARWFNLQKPSIIEEGEDKKREVKFASKICIRFCLDAGYHVLDESTHFSSDLQPSSKHLRKTNIGILELGILSARNLVPMKGRDGRTTDAYCVAKYGNKWVRTRTLLDTLNPKWNEQYTWEVYDLCTVITVGVFDNHHFDGREGARDMKIGKVRIRLSTLQADKVYTHYYPLLILHQGGLRKHGELHLAVRFTCTSWVNMIAQYGRPLLPKMHYVQPISVKHIDWLRHQAMQIVAARLLRAEPPLRREVIEYMLDVDMHMFSLRRSKANFFRIMSLLSGVAAVYKWTHDVCHWKNPVTTCLVHVLFIILVCYPELILPTIFLYLFVIGLWNYRFRPKHPPYMDTRLSHAENAHPDELEEEFDTFPTSKPPDVFRYRYDRLRSVAGRVQTVIGDIATHGERAQSILSWRDPRATAIFIMFALLWAVTIYVTPIQVIVVLVGLYTLRHPRFRGKLPSVPVNFFKRLPAKTDMLL
ncbi:hypothetical protein MLD38_000325 [Melastoma candidum]|uniref:Uncharacterized protein n=1 Tax=Melastoma candidum TaxID=119954 RepID=A0ACB9S9N4_9MYRT|nr:hypothetical protein MLD38_000325 [Melastoma candidum]